MTLSARIAVGPSRRLLIATAGLSTGGVIVAATTAAARWPGAHAAVAAFACIAVLTFFGRALARHRRTPVRTLVWSHGADVAVVASDHDEGPWRVAPPTMTWSGGALGLSVLALAPADGGRTIVLPVLDDDLGSARRDWNRRLLWALRGGAANPRPAEVRT